jgi:hypothetical protein
MASFDNGVSAPGGMSYAAPLLSFQNFSNWAADDPYEAKRKQQEQELNQQRIAAAQRQAELAKTFQGGLPRDAQGNIDYKQAVSMLAQKGDIGALWNGADAMLAQSATNMSPLLSGGGQPPQGQPQGQPASLPARPPAPVSGQPQGDAPGSVISRVTDILPPNSEKIGVVAGNVAKALKVDPNAPLTPQQSQQADNLLRKYAERNNIPSRSGDMPPSANAGLPAPKAAQPSSFRDRFAAAGDGNPQPQPGANCRRLASVRRCSRRKVARRACRLSSSRKRHRSRSSRRDRSRRRCPCRRGSPIRKPPSWPCVRKPRGWPRTRAPKDRSMRSTTGHRELIRPWRR